MIKIIQTICFLSFLYVMLIGNTCLYLIDEDQNKIQVEEENKSNYLEAMSQTEIGKYSFINIFGEVQKLLGRHVINDASGQIIKLNNDYLASFGWIGDTSSTIDELEKTYMELQKKGIDVLYIQARGILSREGKELPIGIQNNDNSLLDQFIEEIKLRKIPCLDSYDILNKNTDSWEKNFYKTDHHWITESAFSVYANICEILNSDYNFKINEEYYDINSFSKEVYKNAFLGAEGRRVGKYYAGLDDFELIFPDFETDFTFYVPDKGIIRNGSFNNAILDDSQTLGKYGFDRNAYYKYIGGDYPFVKIENHMQKNSRKIMVVKDSFGIPVSSFLSLACEELSIVDVRYNEESLGSIIQREYPDIVLFCYGGGYISYPGIVSLEKI